ncbi:lycopene cyclase domain-containing protein [Arthrobacter wenxiniae]|jgi:lycopene cyclase domain-containing protein|uniref:Lycopene cyclase domain-containing protein n=1 Tax=Arthrobacter wenxiniae TaxID=2713570 RepID=A0A7Y7LYG0_9MICC|nr:lycopene cyclase domain-containing protein [Arthrobacter wenxiniae]NVM93969.1 lycopene cyclase domain-containing protein [Arthrobacter wenxiniae]
MSYLLILLLLLVCMALLDARWKLFLFARPGPAAAVLLLGTVFFLAWDISALAAGIFLHRQSPLMTGVMLGPGLPLEEAFFLLFLCYQTMILFTGAVRLLRLRERLAGGRGPQ